jgi:hypothetical protein
MCRDGVFGPIVIKGPASAEYDEDLEPIMLSDWSHPTAESLHATAQQNDGYPMDNGLINGTNVFQGKGKRYEIKFTAGRVHRLRLINTGMDTHFKVGIDKHKMKVIAADFVPIEPFETDMLPIGIGQRYDVLVKATEKDGNFWFRAHVQLGCGQHAEGPVGDTKEQDVRAIVRYNTNTGDNVTSDPPETAWPDFGQECADIPASSLVPKLKQDVPAGGVEQAFEFNQQFNNSVYFWDIKGAPYRSTWGHPSTSPASSYTLQTCMSLTPRQLCSKSPRTSPNSTPGSRSRSSRARTSGFTSWSTPAHQL